jgi:hypothetical protein
MGCVYEGFMIDCRNDVVCSARGALALVLLLGLGVSLGGCAGASDLALNAFADPAKYDNFDCKQLQDTRKSLAVHAAEVQGLMAKADTGVAGPVVAEIAYRNDYIATRASAKLADEVWERDKCVEVPDKPGAAPPPAPVAKRHHGKGADALSKSG